MKAIPDSPPPWLRLLAKASAMVGVIFGILLLSLSVRFSTDAYTVAKKYVSESGDQFRIFAEETSGGSSLDSSYRHGLYEAAAAGDVLTIRGWGLITLSRNGSLVSWDVSEDILFQLLFTIAAFIPLLLMRRYRRPWVRCVCYGIGGVFAALTILLVLGGLFAS